ncbi:hypothetical protein PENSPDRAFT_657576 [Peniophora sp. CONT]|nr:hypothetical protein PENSPDRAFT_657576 [Peniophora sp. CONT]
MDLYTMRFPMSQAYFFKMTPAQRDAFCEQYPNYEEKILLTDNAPIEETATFDAPTTAAKHPQDAPKYYKACLLPEEKAGKELLARLEVALCTAGAVNLARLATPHRGYTLMMTPAQRDAFLESYRKRHVASMSGSKSVPSRCSTTRGSSSPTTNEETTGHRARVALWGLGLPRLGNWLCGINASRGSRSRGAIDVVSSASTPRRSTISASHVIQLAGGLLSRLILRVTSFRSKKDSVAEEAHLQIDEFIDTSCHFGIRKRRLSLRSSKMHYAQRERWTSEFRNGP